ncbi:hypothetical protein [Planomonospora algeriensis]
MKPVRSVDPVDPVGLAGEPRGAGSLTLTLPMITLEFRPPRVGGQEVGRAVGAARALLPALPSRERLAYYGGLGALAAFGLLEWPVAAAIGVGTVIAQRSRNGGGENLRSRRGNAGGDVGSGAGGTGGDNGGGNGSAPASV